MDIDYFQKFDVEILAVDKFVAVDLVVDNRIDLVVVVVDSLIVDIHRSMTDFPVVDNRLVDSSIVDNLAVDSRIVDSRLIVVALNEFVRDSFVEDFDN